MKILTKSLLCGLIITLLIQMLGFSAECANIKNEVFRLHILAESDSTADQQLKLCVRDRVLQFTEDMYSSASNADEARQRTIDNLDGIIDVAQREIRKNGYDYTVSAKVTNMYFTTREYDKFTLPAGYYDALRIEIGQGKGHNWWCVMFPSLCLPSAQKKDNAENYFSDGEKEVIENGQKYEYKFKFVEWFESVRNLFA